jgi:hypothetical protein
MGYRRPLMATSELSVKNVDYPALAADSRQMAVISANLDGEPMSEQDLIRVKTPSGGSTQWAVEVDGNITATDEIVGLLVGVGKRGVLWPYEEPSDSSPVLVTKDLQVAYRVSDEIGDISADDLERYRIGDRKYDWVALANGPEFGYGTGKGKGKRCKEARVLAILRQGETWPVLVTVGPGSLRNVVPFLKRLPVFPHEAVIGLKLVKAKSSGGQPYSQIVPRLVGTVSEEQGNVAKKVYADPIRTMFSAAPSFASPADDISED